MLHLETLRAATRRPFSALQEEVKNIPASKIDNGERFAFVSAVYEDEVRFLGMDTRIGRVFVTSCDTGFYRNVGWMQINDVENCLVCLHRFGYIFDPKEHCHACGNVVCSSCLETAIVVELKGCGSVPVGKCCYWGQEQISIMESKPPRMKNIFGVTHNRYSASRNIHCPDSVSEPDSLVNERGISPSKPAFRANRPPQNAIPGMLDSTGKKPLLDLKVDPANIKMMDLLRESVDSDYPVGGRARGRRSHVETSSLPSLLADGRLRTSPRHYNTAFAPCRTDMFDQYLDEGYLKSRSLELDTLHSKGQLRSATDRGQSERFYLNKSSTDNLGLIRVTKAKNVRGDAALGDGILVASRDDSEETESVDFTLGGRHLHQAFRFDRDGSSNDIFGYGTKSVSGQALLTNDAMEFKQALCIHSKEARALKDAAYKNNRILLGWQVLILRQDLTLLGLGVITAVQKNLQRHSIYRISTDTGTDCWLRLKKRRSQSGTEFQPLRKVLHGFKAAVGPREESSGALQDQDLSKKDEEKAE